MEEDIQFSSIGTFHWQFSLSPRAIKFLRNELFYKKLASALGYEYEYTVEGTILFIKFTKSRDEHFLLFQVNTQLVIMVQEQRLLHLIDDLDLVRRIPVLVKFYLNHLNELKDLNSLALSSKNFIDIDPKPIRTFKMKDQFGEEKEYERQTLKDEALNFFAQHYYPDMIKDLGATSLPGLDDPIIKFRKLYQNEFKR